MRVFADITNFSSLHLLLGSFYCRVRLLGPGEVIVDKLTKELEAGDSLYSSDVNGVVTPFPAVEPTLVAASAM